MNGKLNLGTIAAAVVVKKVTGWRLLKLRISMLSVVESWCIELERLYKIFVGLMLEGLVTVDSRIECWKLLLAGADLMSRDLDFYLMKPEKAMRLEKGWNVVQAYPLPREDTWDGWEKNPRGEWQGMATTNSWTKNLRLERNLKTKHSTSKKIETSTIFVLSEWEVRLKIEEGTLGAMWLPMIKLKLPLNTNMIERQMERAKPSTNP